MVVRSIIFSSSLRSSNSIGVIRSIGNYLPLGAVQPIAVRTSYVAFLIHSYQCLVRSSFLRKSGSYLIRVYVIFIAISLRRADHSSRGILPTVGFRCVWFWNLVIEEALAHWRFLHQVGISLYFMRKMHVQMALNVLRYLCISVM